MPRGPPARVREDAHVTSLPNPPTKGAGAAGLLVGFAVPGLGVAAAIGLMLYFLGAILTTIRARAYAHSAYPALYLLPAAAVLALQLAR